MGSKGVDARIENEEHLEVLANHINEIKRISEGIGEQVKRDNTLLSSMELKMIQGKQMMIKTVNKLDDILNSRAGNVIFYTILFIIIVFMILFLLASSRGEGGSDGGGCDCGSSLSCFARRASHSSEEA